MNFQLFNDHSYIPAYVIEAKSGMSFNKEGLPIEEIQEKKERVILDSGNPKFNIEIDLVSYFDNMSEITNEEFVSIYIKGKSDSIRKVSVNTNELAEKLHLKVKDIIEQYNKGELENFIVSKLKKIKKSLDSFEKFKTAIEEKNSKGVLLPEPLKDPKKLLKITKFVSKKINDENIIELRKFNNNFIAFNEQNTLHLYYIIPNARIGQGAYAIISKVFYLNLAEYVAYKTPISSSGISRETEILKYLNEDGPHEGIQLEPYHIVYNAKNKILSGYLTHLYINGSLADKKAKTIFNELSTEEKMVIVKILVEALSFMANKNIIHCDIKPDNFLMGSNKKIVFADFGGASIFKPHDNEPIPDEYTLRYIITDEQQKISDLISKFNEKTQTITDIKKALEDIPDDADLTEMLNKNLKKREKLREKIFIARKQADVYSTGASLHEMLTGKTHLREDQIIRISRSLWVPNPGISSPFSREHLEEKGYGEGLINLIEKMVNPDSKKRISARKAKKLLKTID